MRFDLSYFIETESYFNEISLKIAYSALFLVIKL